tara:strand:- start:845 stop:2134 length:1290 start_codon:yes stop_codon:yes gene_type:complete
MNAFDFELVQKFMIALLLGALVGMEREKFRRSEQTGSFGGLRTFILVAQAGAISAWLSLHLQSPWLFVMVVLIVGLVATVAFIMENRRLNQFGGLTSEISAITVCLLGGAVMYGYTELAVMLGILTSAILTFKRPLHSLVDKIGTDDLYAIMKLLIASFIVLPLLPNEPIDPWQALNPHRLWLLVVLISAMSLLGYVAVRWLGAAHGAVVTGVTGGLASSTATTLSFARNSKTDAGSMAANTHATGILLAWLVMFIRVLVTIAIVFKPLLPLLLIPFGTMAVTTAALAGSFYWLSSKHIDTPEHSEVKIKNPFSLLAAVKFGMLFATVLLLVKFVQLYTPTETLYVLAAIAGLTDVDAITLSMADYARSATSGLTLAAGAITVAALSNTLVKCGMVMLLGSKPLAKKLVLATVLICLSGAVSITLLRVL